MPTAATHESSHSLRRFGKQRRFHHSSRNQGPVLHSALLHQRQGTTNLRLPTRQDRHPTSRQLQFATPYNRSRAQLRAQSQPQSALAEPDLQALRPMGPATQQGGTSHGAQRDLGRGRPSLPTNGTNRTATRHVVAWVQKQTPPKTCRRHCPGAWRRFGIHKGGLLGRSFKRNPSILPNRCTKPDWFRKPGLVDVQEPPGLVVALLSPAPSELFYQEPRILCPSETGLPLRCNLLVACPRLLQPTRSNHINATIACPTGSTGGQCKRQPLQKQMQHGRTT